MAATRLAEANAVSKLLWLPKGPVIGPMVICAFACTQPQERGLREIGVRDSKLLTPSQREKIAATIKKHSHSLVILSAAELNALMTRRTSLNEIEARGMAKALSELIAKIGAWNVKTIYVDAPDPAEHKYAARIRKYMAVPKNAALVCEHKADLHYAVCGAASILAKVARDYEIEKIKRVVGEDFGNGYSHDEITIAFLKKHLKNPVVQEFVRQKWVTAKRLKTTQLKLGEYA